MADKYHLEILAKGVEEWNRWREHNPRITPDLTNAALAGADLRGADLVFADMGGIDFTEATLIEAELSHSSLVRANLSRAVLWDAKLDGAKLSYANLRAVCRGSVNLLLLSAPDIILHSTVFPRACFAKDNGMPTLQ